VEHLRVAVVGVGHMGYHHARIYSKLQKDGIVELVGVADINEERAKGVAKEFGTKAFSDYRELLHLGVNAVSVAVPTRLHYEVSMFFIKSGVHVLVEKPIADTVEKAFEMAREAERQGVVLLVGHIERYNPAVRRLKDEIRRGILGDVVTLSAKRIGPFNPRVSDVSVVIDLATHDIDIITYLTESRPVRVYAKARRIHEDSRAEDYALIIVTLENEINGVVETNRLTPYKLRMLYVVGTRGVANLNYTEQKLEIHNGLYAMEAIIERDEPLKLEIQHFIECVRGVAKPLTPGIVGLQALMVTQAALNSSRRGEVVEIKW